jgi:hypothetical protein
MIQGKATQGDETVEFMNPVLSGKQADLVATNHETNALKSEIRSCRGRRSHDRNRQGRHTAVIQINRQAGILTQNCVLVKNMGPRGFWIA